MHPPPPRKVGSCCRCLALVIKYIVRRMRTWKQMYLNAIGTDAGTERWRQIYIKHPWVPSGREVCPLEGLHAASPRQSVSDDWQWCLPSPRTTIRRIMKVFPLSDFCIVIFTLLYRPFTLTWPNNDDFCHITVTLWVNEDTATHLRRSRSNDHKHNVFYIGFVVAE